MAWLFYRFQTGGIKFEFIPVSGMNGYLEARIIHNEPLLNFEWVMLYVKQPMRLDFTFFI